jgi:hypothetical protein
MFSQSGQADTPGGRSGGVQPPILCLADEHLALPAEERFRPFGISTGGEWLAEIALIAGDGASVTFQAFRTNPPPNPSFAVLRRDHRQRHFTRANRWSPGG